MEDFDAIKLSAVDFYAELYSEDRETSPISDISFPMPQISQQQNEQLFALPEVQEIKVVVFSLMPIVWWHRMVLEQNFIKNFGILFKKILWLLFQFFLIEVIYRERSLAQ